MSKPTRPTLHIICQAHLDPVWLWPVRDGVAEALATIDSAVNRMREHPRMKFTRSSAQVYGWVEKTDPKLFSEIKRLVRAGRWETIGGWIEQPDCNLPSAESLCRHALYGGNYFSSRFGEKTRPRIGYNVDSFGHSAGIPQLLAHAGYHGYVFMRPQRHEAPHIPDLFWWRSPDGSQVLCQRVPGSYCQTPAATGDDIEQNLRNNWQKCFSPGFDHGIFWLGIGNHGGGPTREHLARIVSLQDDGKLPILKFSTINEYFAEVIHSPASKDIPVHEGELQHNSRGCYAAWGMIKQLNRHAERQLVAAEAAALCAGIDTHLEPAWWALLFNQFHDILAGTCIEQTGEETRHRFGAAIHSASETFRLAVQKMARRVDSRHLAGNTLFAFNPLPWAREVEVTIDTFRQPHGREKITHLMAPDGGRIPIQWLNADASFGPHLMSWGKLCARLKLPACGYTTVHIGLEPEDRMPDIAKAVPIPRNPVRLVILSDLSDTWGHGVSTFDGNGVKLDLGKPCVIERGPLTTIVRHVAQWKRSTIILDVVARANEPAIELRLRVNWQEARRILRLEWPTGIRVKEFVSQTIGGHTSRSASGQEEPAQNWTAFTKNRHAAILVSDGASSVSAKAGVLSVIVARSVPYAEHNPIPVPDTPATGYLDQGWQTRRFWTVRLEHESPLTVADRLSASLLTGTEALIDSCHPGDQPEEQSYFSVEPESVHVHCLKQAEHENAWIVRLQNASSEPVAATLRLGDQTAKIMLSRFELATLRCVKAKTGVKVTLVDVLERPISTKCS